MSDKVTRLKGGPFPIDATPALEARRMGARMMMIVLHESVSGSRQDEPVQDVTRDEVYVKVMASLRVHHMGLVEAYSREFGAARLKEHVHDVVVSLPDGIVLHLNDLWDDGQSAACAREYLFSSDTLCRLRDEAYEAHDRIGKNAA